LLIIYERAAILKAEGRGQKAEGRGQRAEGNKGKFFDESGMLPALKN